MVTRLPLPFRGKRQALDPQDPRVESRFRDLYTRVLMHTGVEGHTILGVTSPIDGEGKTTIATGLAIRLANDGALAELTGRAGSILVLECSRGNPEVGRELGIAATPGLLQYLGRECPLEAAIKQSTLPALSVLPLGGVSPNFPILIRTAAMQDLMERLRERFDLVVVDLPSAATSTDTQVLGGLADYLLLVVRSGVTPARVVRQALEEIDAEKLVGIVLNDHHADLPGWLDERL
ncbi:MAG: CpsD/CapB family tyrosine-protein kinase [Chloroflexota bacterium]|nr:CpsD/CapB family tyrosine-protein kinase [Chloroflexota bacterium]